MIDAKNIFIVSQAKLQDVEWERPTPESEWSYLGQGQEFDLLDLQSRIAEFLISPQAFVVTDRHRSKAVSILQAGLEVRKELMRGDVTICDSSFDRFMVFNAVGVMKKGRHRSTASR